MAPRYHVFVLPITAINTTINSAVGAAQGGTSNAAGRSNKAVNRP